MNDPDTVLRGLIDQQGIRETIYRYASAIDGKEYEVVRSLLAADARARYGNRDWVVGADEIVRWLILDGENHLWRHHLLSVYHIEVEHDAARTLTYHTSHCVWASDPHTATIVVARYHDRLRRDGERWVLTQKFMEIGWRGVSHAHQKDTHPHDTSVLAWT